MVKSGKFSDYHSLDFANPAGLMAIRYPLLRFAAFSDSVVVTSRPESVTDFLSVLNFMFSNWFSDFIFVRGGLAIGDLVWVDQPSIDVRFQQASNLAFARLYGKALIEAIELQEKSGPGMACFVSDAAARVLEEVDKNLVFSGPTDILVWPTAEQLHHWCKTFAHLAMNQSFPPEFRRHICATHWYMTQIKKSRKAMPRGLSIIATPTTGG